MRTTTEPRPCPCCGRPGVARVVDGYYVCADCAIQWRRIDADDLIEPLSVPEPRPPEEPPFAFSREELERLEAYRGAVQAGLYEG